MINAADVNGMPADLHRIIIKIISETRERYKNDMAIINDLGLDLLEDDLCI
jgi:hypothetical protein